MPEHAHGPMDFDRALEAYSCQARSVTSRTATRGVMYTAAAGAALALAPASDAAIQPSSVSGSRLLPSGSTSTFMQIDINGDAINDFTLSLFRQMNGTLATRQNLTFVRGVTGNGVAMTSSDLVASRVPLSGSVGPSNSFRATGAIKFFQTSGATQTGGWPGNSVQNGYLGFKFLVGSNTNYGWIRLSITNESHGGLSAPVGFTVSGGAWETAPNTALVVGVIPEPSPASGLALLAAGAAGVTAWRRRKQAKK